MSTSTYNPGSAKYDTAAVKALLARFPADPIWGQVDSYAGSHLSPPTRPYHSVLAEAKEAAAAAGLPPIDSDVAQAKSLALQCRAAGVSHMLEVGTLGGYTPICIASLNPGICIISLEVNPKFAEVARRNIEAAGFSDRVEVIVGPALETIAKLTEEITAGTKEKFGMVFIDADKENNWNYFDRAVSISRKGGMIFVDNVVFQGRVVMEDDEFKNSEMVLGARRVIERAGKDERVEAVLIQTVSARSYDGMLSAVVL